MRYRTVKPQVAGQFWFAYTFAKDVVTKDQELTIDVPRDKYVKVVSPDMAPQIKDEGVRKIYTETLWRSSLPLCKSTTEARSAATFASLAGSAWRVRLIVACAIRATRITSACAILK